MFRKLTLLTLVLFFHAASLTAIETTKKRTPIGSGNTSDRWADKCRVSGTAYNPTPAKATIDVTTGSIGVQSKDINVSGTRHSDKKCCFADWSIVVNSPAIV